MLALQHKGQWSSREMKKDSKDPRKFRSFSQKNVQNFDLPIKFLSAKLR